MTRTIIAAALAAVALVPAAHAAPSELAVAYGDLALGTVAGQAALTSRLHDAAAKLCGPALTRDNPGSEQSIRQHQDLYNACIGRLTERAMTGIKSARN
jgi:UrcA family protein